MFKSFTSVQLDPFQSSVCCFGDVAPPNAIAAGCNPKPPSVFLAVFKSLTSDQELPFQDSVTATGVVVPPP